MAGVQDLRAFLRSNLQRSNAGKRALAVYRAWRHLNNLPGYHPDVVRDLWRQRHGTLDFSEVIADVGDLAWPPKMDRYMILWQFLRSVLHLPGELAECGVYKGGTARMIAKTASMMTVDKQLFLLDTFKGLPVPTPGLDANWQQGDIGDVTLEKVQAYLADFSNITFLPGLFSQNFQHIADQDFCFVHVDADLYQSIRECCEFFYPRMVQGGIILFDDYGFADCPGAKLATDEYFANVPEQLVYLPTAQAFVVKQC